MMGQANLFDVFRSMSSSPIVGWIDMEESRSAFVKPFLLRTRSAFERVDQGKILILHGDSEALNDLARIRREDVNAHNLVVLLYWFKSE